jgi:WD40 repeat protein
MKPELRIFISSPGDVNPERRCAALVVEHLARDYARFFDISFVLWETEPMLASGHFQDNLTAPSESDILLLILWSRLGSPLPKRTAVREYRGIYGQSPVTGTEWEYEDALAAQQRNGKPEILAYRKSVDPQVPLRDKVAKAAAEAQWSLVERFWKTHFIEGHAAYREFADLTQFEAAIERDLRHLIERGIGPDALSHHRSAASAWLKGNPFRGLESYHYEHTLIFFGRSQITKIAIERLIDNATRGQPFLLVLGASGSGKSSLVQAGIVPSLALRGVVSEVGVWRRAVMRPRGHPDGPFAALASALTAEHALPELLAAGQAADDLARHLAGAVQNPSYPIVAALARLECEARQRGEILPHQEARLVIVIDQLEELFTMTELTPDSRKNFVACVVGLLNAGRIYVVATMRNDHWHRASEIPQLVSLAEGNGRLDLLAPTQAEIAEMVRRPAEAAGLAFEIDPVTEIRLDASLADEAAKQPGSLPLLSFLLDALYVEDVERGGGSILTCGSAQKLGGLRGAIAQRAETAFEVLPESARAALPKVLRGLVTVVSSDAVPTAREAPISGFREGSPERLVVDALLAPEMRLLVSTGDGSGARVRVAHEALITHWQRAKRQIGQDRDDLRVRAQIEEAEAECRAAIVNRRGRRKPSDYLLRDPRLANAVDLARRWPEELGTELTSFIHQSVRHAKAAARRRRMLAVTVMLALTGLTVASIHALGVAEAQRNEALAAQSRFLARDARIAVDEGNAALGTLLALAALPSNLADAGRPFVSEAEFALEGAFADRHEQTIFKGHSAAVDAVAFSPDGQILATGGQDDTVRLWSPEQDTPLIVLQGHRGVVWSVAFSSDGSQLVTASADKTARIWNCSNGALVAVLAGGRRDVRTAAFVLGDSQVATASWDGTVRLFDAKTGAAGPVMQANSKPMNAASVSHNGARLATAFGDGTITVWDLRTATRVAEFHADTPATAVAFSSDDGQIASGYLDGTVRLWGTREVRGGTEAPSEAQAVILRGHERQINMLAFSPDGSRLVSASDDKVARLWNTGTGDLVALMRGHEDAVITALFSPDGNYLVTGSADASERIWDSRSGAVVAVLRDHGGEVLATAFAPDGHSFVTGSADKTARLWRIETKASRTVFHGHGGKVLAVALSPDDRLVLTGSADGEAALWNADTGEIVAMLNGHQQVISCAIFSPDGTRALTASWDRTARVWDARTGALQSVLDEHTQPITDCDFSPDGKRVVTASYDRTARVWDVATGTRLKVFDQGDNRVNSARFSGDGARIVTTSDDHKARLWDAGTYAPVAVLEGHKDAVRPVAFSHDGELIITGSDDHDARVWEAKTGAAIATLKGHTDLVSDVAFSPTRDLVATASWDKTARLWNPRTGKEVAVLSGHTGQVKSVAFSPDGSYVVTASADGTARLWDSRTGALGAVLRGHALGITSAVFARDSKLIATASDDATARLWTPPPRCQPLIDAALATRWRNLSSDERHQYFLADNIDNDSGVWFRIVRPWLAPLLSERPSSCE